MASRTVSFGVHLRTLRQRRGLTQSELAARIDKPQSSISNYESDDVSPTLDVLQSLALALGVRLGELVDDDEQPLPSAAWHRDLLELNGYVAQLPTADYEELLLMLRVILRMKLERIGRGKWPDLDRAVHHPAPSGRRRKELDEAAEFRKTIW